MTMMPEPLACALAAAAGALGWSFTEYALHRSLGHRKVGRGWLARLGGRLFTHEHLAHHADSGRFGPTATKVKVALVVVGALAVAGVLAAGAARGTAFAAGFAALYAAYEVLHRRIHTHAPVLDNAYGRWARRHHLHHHFRDPRKNHGVTSPVWDIVFGTWAAPAVLRVPAGHDLPWLRDERTRERWAPFITVDDARKARS